MKKKQFWKINVHTYFLQEKAENLGEFTYSVSKFCL